MKFRERFSRFLNRKRRMIGQICLTPPGASPGHLSDGPPVPFEQGMTLAPGDSAQMGFDLLLAVPDPHLRDLVIRGESVLSLEQGDSEAVGVNKFIQTFHVLVDGNRVARFQVSYSTGGK